MTGRPDSLYDFICTICDQHFEQIPEGAREISRAYYSRVVLWEFPDGTQHSLKKQRKQTATAVKEEI